MKHILLTIGSILLLDVFFLLFITTFHIGMLIQAIVAILLMLYAFYFVLFKKRTHIIIVIIAIIPLLSMIALTVYGNISSVNYNEDAVIVLGTGIRGEKVRGNLLKRLDQAAAYYGKNPDAIIIVCGGQGGQEDITEAQAMENYLLTKNIPSANIIKEEKSASTYENLSFSKEILNEHFPLGFSCVLITNEYNIYRATQTAQDIGFSAGHSAVNTPFYAAPAEFLREMIFIMKMWVLPE
ncbi:MAG: YdcF family protein [Oscillospiraceae bacterium]|nr:YdcF family protein [Oscillospiraceae bacterium]